MAHGGMVRNCLITGNTSAPAVVAMTGNSGTYGGTHKLQNCTIAGNVGIGFKIYANSTRSNVENCIIYSNTTDIDVTGSDTNKLWHICASFTNFPPDQGNITNNPLFTGAATGNYRVVASSPCVNTGTNENWMTNAVDLDGHRRIDRFNGQVDIGAYEFEPQGSMFRMY